MQEGGFYSAEDADSYPTHGAPVKKEGAFYVWTAEEIRSILDKEISDEKNKRLYDIFCHHFNVKESGNVKKYQVRFMYIVYVICYLIKYKVKKVFSLVISKYKSRILNFGVSFHEVYRFRIPTEN